MSCALKLLRLNERMGEFEGGGWVGGGGGGGA